MAKRFVATEIWDEDWFLDMPLEYKLFWFYLLSACNHAGLFRVNIKKFCGINEVKISADKALSLFNNGKERIRIVSESLWLVEDFFVFQYGTTFNPNSSVHFSIEKAYNQANIKMTSIRGLTDLKERDKDKDKVKDKYSRNGEKIFGEKFIESDCVLLSDGTTQKLGKIQKLLFDNDSIKPKQVFKGQIS